MRRIFALLLIATSGWLLHQTANHYLGGTGPYFWAELQRHTADPEFLAPAIGGVLGLLGGLTVFFNGPGGAALAMIGGVSVAGFAMTLKETFELDHLLDNEMAVGALMLMLAAMTASTTRVTRRRKTSWDIEADRPYSSGRRVY
jgi:hypothetical protein